MHKATGWMLREIGKKDKKVLIDFLDKNSNIMPTVMRSYAREIWSNCGVVQILNLKSFTIT